MSQTGKPLVKQDRTLTEKGKLHALVNTAEILVGGPRGMLQNEVFPEFEKNELNILEINSVIFNREANQEMQDKIYETHAKMLEPLIMDIEAPISAKILGPGTVDPGFFLLKAKIPDAQIPTIDEFAKQLAIEFASPFGPKTNDPNTSNSFLNVFLPPPPIVPPPLDAPDPAALATCISARQANYQNKLGLSFEQMMDNMPNLVFAYNNMIGDLKMPQLPNIPVNPITQPYQFQEQIDLSTASFKGLTGMIGEFQKPPEIVNFLTSLSSPVDFAKNLRDKAAKAVASASNASRSRQPMEQAIKQSATETAAAQLTSSIVAAVIGPGGVADFTFTQYSGAALETIEKRISNIKYTFEISKRKSAELARTKKRTGPIGSYREEFLNLTKEIQGQQTSYKLSGKTAHAVSVSGDLICLNENFNVPGDYLDNKIKALNIKDIKTPSAGKDDLSTAHPKILTYLNFMTPYHSADLRNTSDRDGIVNFLRNNAAGWSSCAMTVRAVIIALRAFFPATGQGTYYTQPYDPVKGNALAVITKGGQQAKFIGLKNINDTLNRVKAGDFFIIQKEVNGKAVSGTEHVAMWMDNNPPELNKMGKVFEGGQADLAQPYFVGKWAVPKSSKNQASGTTSKKTNGNEPNEAKKEFINGASVGFTEWKFFKKNGNLHCQYLSLIHI